MIDADGEAAQEPDLQPQSNHPDQMQESLNESPTMRFSSAKLPERERATMLREVFGRGLCNMDIVPLTDAPEAEAELRMLPGLNLMWGRNSPHRFEMTHDLNRGSDEILMGIFPRGLRIRDSKREFDFTNGGASLMAADDVASAECSSTFEHISLRLQPQLLAMVIPKPTDVMKSFIPSETEALQLLVSYLDILRNQSKHLSAEVERAAVTHIYDLVALAAGTTRDATELPTSRGLRAARLDRAKRLILEKIGQPDLSVDEVAAGQRISPRYLQMLFEDQGTTFSAFVLKERLANAHRMLRNSRLADRPIGLLALDAGFGDIAYFNRVFRRVFGETPSDVRARARSDPEE